MTAADSSISPAGLASISDAVDWFVRGFRAERAKGLSLAYQFELAGQGGGELFVRIAKGSLDTGPGRTPAPDVTLRMLATDLFGILAGSENPDLLFMERRIEIDGDLSLALKLRSLFSAAG